MSISSPPAKRFITTREASALVGVTRQTLRAWIADPTSTFPRPLALTGRTHRYDFEEVMAWIASRRWLARIEATAPTSQPA
jgi:excisionase family DNA binding protein